MAPRVSGGVAHAMAVGVLRRASERLGRSPNRSESGPHVGAERNADLPDNPVPLLREILVPDLHSFRTR